jgi:hypothetical protein
LSKTITATVLKARRRPRGVQPEIVAVGWALMLWPDHRGFEIMKKLVCP